MNTAEKKNILVPMDFRRQALSALNQAISIARILDRQIVMVYVHQEKGALSSIFSAKQNNLFDEAVKEKLEALAGEKSEEYKVRITTLLDHNDSIHSSIVALAQKLNSELIIMGRGEKGNEKVIGANTSRVIRNAKVPVITVDHAKVCDRCRKILLPLDLTQETRQKTGWGIQLAKVFGAEIQIVSALWDTGNQAIKNQLTAQLKQTETFIKKAGVKCSARLIEADKDAKSLVPIILKHMEEQGDIDMVLIMTQQENALKEFFVGSHATEMIRKSPVPVMSVVPHQTGTIIWGA